ncbi:protein of unknown function (plasmid) [Azospirillum lipoferum 4B]|uniref:Uncharacterized protein n=1 Tax=Azospirillum lipoferum (strain 4B) TaxID=862719 RepID=G7ZH18_AZOL4|nr:protein of unknown function [Azospirillum lipoferum 4B]
MSIPAPMGPAPMGPAPIEPAPMGEPIGARSGAPFFRTAIRPAATPRTFAKSIFFHSIKFSGYTMGVQRGTQLSLQGGSHFDHEIVTYCSATELKTEL